MKLVNSLNEIGDVPLQVNGHLMRLSMSKHAQSKRKYKEIFEVYLWIERNCSGSAIINDYFTWNPIDNRDVLLVDFSDQDLEAFCAQWGYARGANHEQAVDCCLLRHSDYVDYVHRVARERWNLQVPPILRTNSSIQWVYEQSDEDNRQRWQDLYRLRHVNGQVTRWEMLNEEAQSKLIRFNDQLREVERWAFAETMAIRGRTPDLENPGEFKLQKTVNPPFVGDFFRLDEVKVNIAFVLAESEPHYDEDEDNFLYEFKRSIYGLTFDSLDWWETGFDKSDMQKDRFKCETEPTQRCFLFNHLMRCAGLDLADLLCIGDVFVDVILTGSYVTASLTDPDDIRPRYAPTKRLWNDDLSFRHHNHRTDAKTFEERISHQLGLRDLSDSDHEHCVRINAELRKIEHQSLHLGYVLRDQLNARVADQNNVLDDYEMALHVSHILHRDDEMAVNPRYNVLLRQDGYRAVPSKKMGEERIDYYDLEYDWGEPSMRDDWGFPQCGLFHDLQNDHDLTYADLPRIDRIHAIFEIRLQRFFREKPVDRAMGVS